MLPLGAKHLEMLASRALVALAGSMRVWEAWAQEERAQMQVGQAAELSMLLAMWRRRSLMLRPIWMEA